MIIDTLLIMIKFIYHFFIHFSSMISIIFNTFMFFCTATSHLLPYIIVLFIILCVVSKFIKLKRPDEKNIITLLNKENNNSAVISYFPIANKGCYFDYPENSIGAIKEVSTNAIKIYITHILTKYWIFQCINKKCRNILLDLEITKCGKLVILHKNTLEKGNIYKDISQIDFNELENFNISEHHPLSKKFAVEKILLLEDFLTQLEELDLTVYLMANNTKKILMDALKKIVNTNEIFTKKVIFCCKSPIIIYQVRL